MKHGKRDKEHTLYWDETNPDRIFCTFTTRGKYLHGVRREYDEDGNLREKNTFKNGREHGKYKKYYADGKVAEKGTYRKNRQHGARTWYNTDGTIQRQETYKWGKN